MVLDECLGQLEAVCRDLAGVQVMDPPGRLLVTYQVPDETPEAVLQNCCRLRRTPDVVVLERSIERAAEEGVEAIRVDTDGQVEVFLCNDGTVTADGNASALQHALEVVVASE